MTRTPSPTQAVGLTEQTRVKVSAVARDQVVPTGANPGSTRDRGDGTSAQALASAEIAGIDAPIITQYFAALNAEDFRRTSELFAADGALQPPFESLVIGPEAIAEYLTQSAKGLVLLPQQGTVQTLADGCTQYEIVGQVQTPWFRVNVGWLFILSPDQKIFVAKIKLLASLQELLQIRQSTEQQQAKMARSHQANGDSGASS